MSTLSLNDVRENEYKRRRLIVAAACAIHGSTRAMKYTFLGRQRNRSNAYYDRVIGKIVKMKENSPIIFTRMYPLSPASLIEC
jgi:hypothetical protein